MPNPFERASAQALYLEMLLTKAKKNLPEEPPVDPQGRCIVDVSLSDEDWKSMYRKKHHKGQEEVVEEQDVHRFRDEVLENLGHSVTNTTSVSLDLQTKSNQPASPKLVKGLESYLPEDKSKDILSAYQGLAKGRIISLQQETHFHAHLIGQMLKTAVAKGEGLDKRQQREKIFGDTGIQLQIGINNALKQLNQQVMKLQAKALEKAHAAAAEQDPFNQEIFATTLNAELDEARKKLLPEIAKTLRVEVIKATGIQFDKNITKHLSKHLAEATSATPNDVLHMNKGTGTVSFIGASKRTSHHQELGGEHVADRMIYSHHLTADEEVVPLSHRQQVRVPSIAVKKFHPITLALLEQDVKRKKLQDEPSNREDIKGRIKELDKKGKLSEEELEQIVQEYNGIELIIHGAPREHEEMENNVYNDKLVKQAINARIINDTEDKIHHLQDKYKLGGDGRQEDGADLPNAFVYNLYTALNNKTPLGRYDEARNKQSQSADHILQAAHAHNARYKDRPLCLVQAISVNGWGHELSIQEGNPDLVNEAALMTQMASLHTIYGALKKVDQDRVKELFEVYKEFLETEDTSFYKYLRTTRASDKSKPEKLELADSRLHDVLVTLEAIKNTKNEPRYFEPENDFKQVSAFEQHRRTFTYSAKAALVQLFKEGAFGHHENGYTYQALSVFVENSSMGGCKSANERAQAVNGRVSILDFVSLPEETRDALLKDYLSPEEAARLNGLASELETAIKNRNLVNIRGNLDQLYEALNLEGFQALISFIDQGGHAKLASGYGSWNTNNSETVQTHVENADKWQCHKGLTDNVLREFCGVEKISWGKEIKNTAIAAGVLTGLGGVGAGATALAFFLTVGIAAFPPVGIAIGIGVAAAVGAVLLVSVARWIYKAATNKSATEARFEDLQQENSELVEDAAQKRPKPEISPAVENSELVQEAAQERPKGQISPALVTLVKLGHQLDSGSSPEVEFSPPMEFNPPIPEVSPIRIDPPQSQPLDSNPKGGTVVPLTKASLGSVLGEVQPPVITETLTDDLTNRGVF